MKKKLLLLSLLSVSMVSTTALKAQTTIIGITDDDKVFRMADANMPGSTTTPITITGLAAGQIVAGSDYRPNTGQLYVMGYAAATSTAQLYTLDPATGAATAVGATATLALGTGSIGFDFNPTVDRIRVVAANGKNYRLHPVTGAIAATDADLQYAVGDVNFGQAPSIGAVAYTNSYIGAEATTLYDYDETRNILASQIPPNNGTLNTIGLAGILVNSNNRSVDMDIYFNPSSNTNTAYLVANTLTSNNDNLYTVNTTTGAATSLGQIGSGIAVKDIAVVIDRNVPSAISGNLIYALTRTNRNLISFDSDMPGTIRTLTSITGVTAGYFIVGMDFRPATRTLYALGYSAAATAYQLYALDPSTGVATAVNAMPINITLDSTTVGFDFNPTVDRIRLTSGNGVNYRLNPNDGTIAATDSMLAYNIGDVRQGVRPNIGAVAYTNSYARATTTTLYGIDDSLAALTTIAPPNNGRVNTILGNILALNAADRTTDLDFYYDSTTATNIGYLAANLAGTNNDNLYTINATTGVVSSGALIGNGIPVSDIAVMLRYSGPTLGIEHTMRNLSLTAFPNPVGNKVTISASKASGVITSYRLLDIYGRTLQTAIVSNGSQILSVSTANLAPGTYFIHVTVAGNEQGIATIIKQ